MSSKTIETFTSGQLKQGIPSIMPGDTVKVFQKIKEKDKERLQPFEGVVLARKHGKGISSTITVRRISSGVGVEKIFPVHSPLIEKIEVVKRSKVRRAKLYYLRTAKGRKSRLKRKEFEGLTWEAKKAEESSEKLSEEEK
ncbi:MAG: 50S ribosomal protein L19 [Candidatus Nealsonbacteria bacterium RIFOXYB1_FULL_40_15]|uniref:Large ribosomal subunit protein bL19 n=2 Tax=Candidatus Nealsoniibacteriota TaxID=1817911 RepID=A0A1G2EV48_9BACT|nr:MAG: 50S ribosomal protein L19 [Candidatus Nealsonbacteria bacterium RIFOXYB1_FULL_40_15]OGZ28340.1 MAG: 50S ribosomal protein L19 [Candidatus Nealsonbacteria bacterium RIFOXYD1_FULL_39_11]OGZ29148.1 MAG: 50S ribosomal protein L19 [Candidatus Nealsonbacteria bacterium RIFOXYC1_FULL_40_7]